MSLWLKQGTGPVVISMGPFLLNTDGVTLVTNLVGSGSNQTENTSTGIRLSKNGGAFAARDASGLVATTYDAFGNYLVTLQGADHNTLGALRMQFANGAAFCPVWMDFMVVPANMWNSLFGTGGSIPDAAANAAGGLLTTAAGSLDMDEMNVDIEAIQASTAGLTFTSPGKVDSNPLAINGVSTAAVTTIKPVLGLAVDGVIPTTTNLTNAPTVGDLTAVMKASVTTAATAATPTAAAVTTAVSITGDLSATMKTSVTTAATAATPTAAAVTAGVTLATGAITDASIAAGSGLKAIRSNTAVSGAATSITLDAGASATNNFYNNDLILLTGGTGAGQARFISAYNGGTQVATVAAWATNPDNTTTFAILPFDAVAGASAPTAAQVATAVWQDLLASADFGTASSIGALLKADINVALNTLAPAATALSTVQWTNVRAALIDALNTGVPISAAVLNSIADAIFARSLGTESYAALHAVPTFAQMQFMLLSLLNEFGIVGTVITNNKIDGTTSAMTSNIDSATVPTLRTRAT